MTITLRHFVDKYIEPFEGLDYVFDEARGFIVWRPGTGNNVELLHIRTFEKGRGHGRSLLADMVRRMESPPYHSVFGFTRVGNEEAQKFYGGLGFSLHRVPGIYQEGDAILFVQSWSDLQRLAE